MLTLLNGSKWKNRWSMFGSLLRRSSSLKYFPPEFILRDPISSSIDVHSKNGYDCALILLNLEGFHHILNSFPVQQIEFIERMVKQKIKEILPIFFEEEEIIGVRIAHGEDYCLFVRSKKGEEALELHYQAQKIRDELERRVRAKIDPHTIGPLHFRIGFFIIDQLFRSSGDAVSLAYHYAHAIATKKLPSNFYYTRKQLSDIIREGNIKVLVQPICNLKSGEVYGWEVLTRGPENTPFFEPLNLFDFAFQSDQLLHTEFLVFQKAIQEISSRKIEEQVFINVTAVTIGQPLFLEQVMDYLSLFPSIDTHQIILEITEGHAIRDYRHVAEMMENYRSLGFRFAVDDAGAGYSSLQTISELIPDMIKIDKSLIQNIDRIALKQSLLKAFVGIAQEINCQIIAEGIERHEEALLLSQHEVHMGQGYYFSRPEPMLIMHEKLRLNELKNKILLPNVTGEVLA